MEINLPISPIRFHILQPFFLPQRKELKAHLRRLMKEEQKVFISLDYVFCDDEYLLKINQDYLQHDDLTDIITFNLSEDQDEIIGEIYISVERVRDNALLFETSFLNELYRVIFHGALHLCGYKDKEPKDKEMMRHKEDYYLRSYK